MVVITSLDDLRAGKRLQGEAISMRVVEGPATIRNDDFDEVLYVLEEDVGIYLPRGEELKVNVATDALAPRSGAAPDRSPGHTSPPRRSAGATNRRPLVSRVDSERDHAVRRIDPARPRARSLSPLRRNALHPERLRISVGRQIEDFDRSRLVRLSSETPGALRREHRPQTSFDSSAFSILREARRCATA